MNGEQRGGTESAPKRKLIEVALPLEAINRESAREKSIRHGHPSTLHLWWARRPLAAARAVLFAQLVDDPSSHPDRFPTEEDQAEERRRLHELIERLVIWENIHDKKLLAEAHEEILKSTDGNPPPVLDPFAGGGSIPLEAQRLGLEAHASDLNPVAVLINKALIEIPPKFADRPPVFPGLAETELAGWKGAAGLAADVRAYGDWMCDEAEERIGHHYPTAKLPDGSDANVIAWIWARTVTCPNPTCGIKTPLVKSWWLGKKVGRESYLRPRVVVDGERTGGKRVDYEIHNGSAGAPTEDADGTVGRKGGRCVACEAAVPLAYIRTEGRAGRIKHELMATVVEGERRRVYVAPSAEQRLAAQMSRPKSVPSGSLGHYPRDIKASTYGLTDFADLFTNRQLLALTTFSDLVGKARERALHDGLQSGMPAGDRLASGSDGAEAYADAIATYLALSVSRSCDYWSSICSWHSRRETMRNVFGRQAIPMVWDFAEALPFSRSSGGYRGQLEWVAKVVAVSPSGHGGVSSQRNAGDAANRFSLLSTDPPYYDNIGYSDLSDFFYVWLRRSLSSVHPGLFSTMLVPKADELVANPYRHESKDGAKRFFEDGFREVFGRARASALPEFPTTVYYAFKQSEVDEGGEASTGWETLLDGMIDAGWTITGTWPMRSELGNRMLSQEKNALASSIVLALRPRPDDAPTTDRRGLIEALQDELPERLRELQQGRIAPVDLPQAAIGPGMAVFSRYSAVIEPDGSRMTVRTALARINEILDQVLNEQEGDFDPISRFAISWYRQHGYDRGEFGDANNLANARNTSVDAMARSGILTSAAGKVTLLSPASLGGGYDAGADDQVSAWEVLHHMIAAVGREGIWVAAGLLSAAENREHDPVDADLVKELAFLLYSIAEKSGRSKDALAFNELATSWPDIVDAARESATSQEQQGSFDL